MKKKVILILMMYWLQLDAENSALVSREGVLVNNKEKQVLPNSEDTSFYFFDVQIKEELQIEVER